MDVANMNLPKLVERFGTEEKCRAYLEELRWPEGVKCPRCESESVSRITTRNQLDCNDCRYRFSVTTGTLFHDSHLPLTKWFMATYLVTESKKGISAKQLQRMLRVAYRTAWYLSHRIRDAMGDDDQPLLRGIVEADETFVAGRRFGVGRGRYRDEDNPPVAGVAERGGKSDCESSATGARERSTGSSGSTSPMRPRRSTPTSGSAIRGSGTRTHATRRSITPPTSTSAPTFTPTRLRASGRSSSAGSSAAITKSARSTCPPTWTRWSSASTTGRTPTSSVTRCLCWFMGKRCRTKSSLEIRASQDPYNGLAVSIEVDASLTDCGVE